MNNNNLKGVSYLSGFFILIGLALLGIIISGLIGGVIVKLVTGEEYTAAMKNRDNADIMRLIQSLIVVISMFIPPVIVAGMMHRNPFRLLGFRKEVDLRQVGLIVAILFSSLFIASALGYLNKELPFFTSYRHIWDELEKSYSEQVEMMLDLRNFSGYMASILLMAFLPAVGEEMLFRGGLQNFLTRATGKAHISIIIVSILFSIVHFSFYGFLPRLFLGMMLGYVYYYSGNLWLAILAHFLNNAIAVTVAYFYIRQGNNFEEAMNKDLPTIYWGFLALPFFIVFLILLKKVSWKQNNQQKQNAENEPHGI